jgi:hypothetical protein
MRGGLSSLPSVMGPPADNHVMPTASNLETAASDCLNKLVNKLIYLSVNIIQAVNCAWTSYPSLRW